ADDIRPGDAAGAMLGDIVLALETVRREASLEDKQFDHHLRHLVIHGLLHLFGYDHMNDDEARIMESLERDALARMGIGDPYAGEA
ncbi:MAG: rRNA maturation RNase YbeY, partial [Nitratireductor sp.]|nr:rRNA maturation RNase YbeY [Nitratireductor sp.]